MAKRAEASALKTFVEPKFIEVVVAFLCREDAGMITRQDINVWGVAVMYRYPKETGRGSLR
jgi:hypothetical protein